jgi:hypothetical protein
MRLGFYTFYLDTGNDFDNTILVTFAKLKKSLVQDEDVLFMSFKVAFIGAGSLNKWKLPSQILIRRIWIW